jgi:hypothetical protein
VVHKHQVVRRLTFFPEQDASPDASHQYSLDFCFQSLSILQFDCALSLQDLYDIVTALRFPSRLSLFTFAIIDTGR